MTTTETTPSDSPTPTRWQRVLPPQLFVALVLAMISTRWWPVIELIPWPRGLVGLALLIPGAAVNVSNAVRFEREQTNIVTFDDPTLLLTDGWFRRTRNPMYVGFSLMLIGVAIMIGTLTAWLGPATFLIAANWWYIPFEERRLRATFGAAYNEYCERVRRWC